MKELTRSLRSLARAAVFGAFLANPDISLDHLCSAGVISPEITGQLSLKQSRYTVKGEEDWEDKTEGSFRPTPGNAFLTRKEIKRLKQLPNGKILLS